MSMLLFFHTLPERMAKVSTFLENALNAVFNEHLDLAKSETRRSLVTLLRYYQREKRHTPHRRITPALQI